MCPFGSMAVWQSDTIVVCWKYLSMVVEQYAHMSVGQSYSTVSLAVWQSDRIAVLQYANVTLWQSDFVAVWNSDSLKVLQLGSLTI